MELQPTTTINHNNNNTNTKSSSTITSTTTTTSTILTKTTRRIGSVASHVRRWGRIIFYIVIGLIVVHSFIEFSQLNQSFLLKQPSDLVLLSSTNTNTNINITTSEVNTTIELSTLLGNNITSTTVTTTTTSKAVTTTKSRRDEGNNATTTITSITEKYYYVIANNTQLVSDPDPSHPKIWPAASKVESYNRSSTTINSRSSININNLIPTETATIVTSRILQDNSSSSFNKHEKVISKTIIDVWKIQLDQLQFHYKFIEQQPTPSSSEDDTSTIKNKDWKNQTEYMISILQKSEQRFIDGFSKQQYQYEEVIAKKKTKTTKSNMNNIDENNIDQILVIQEYPLYDITVTIESLDPLLVYGIDESYTVSIPYPTTIGSSSSSLSINITAVTIYGAMYAYQSLRQLLELTPTKNNNDVMKFSYHYRIYDTPINIIDEPHFSYRGLLIDTARHYVPIHYIIHNFNIMEMNKLNVFHWHVTDHQAWPYLSKQYPELAIMGAYCPTDVQGVITPSTPNILTRRQRQRQRRLKAVFTNPRTNVTTIKVCDIYTMEDVQTVIQTGADRGIRIVFEFDTPGHATVIGNSHPELMTECPTIHDPLDVTKDIVYEFVHKLYDEISDLYTTNSVNSNYYNATQNDIQRGRRKRTTTRPTYDDWVHIGGDEVNTTCWEHSAAVQQYMKKHNITNATELVALFETDLFETVDKLQKSPMVWQEIFETNAPIIPRNTIIDFWKVWEYADKLQVATQYGYDVIFSAGFYLDYFHILFDEFYNFNLYQHLGTTEMQAHALGGSASMWTESVPPHRLSDSIWPRTSAMGERLWTNSQHPMAAATYPQRMERFRCLMITQLNTTIGAFGNTNCEQVLYNEFDTD